MEKVEENLGNYFQFNALIVATEGEQKTNEKVYKKEELIEWLIDELPEDYGYSLFFAYKPEDKGR